MSKNNINNLAEATLQGVVEKVLTSGKLKSADLRSIVNQTLQQHPKAPKAVRAPLEKLSVELKDDEARRLARLGITLSIVGIVLAIVLGAAGIAVSLVNR